MIKTLDTSTPGTLTFSRRPNDAIYAALRDRQLDIWWNMAAELADRNATMKLYAAEVFAGTTPDFGIPSNVAKFAEQLDHVVTLLRCGGQVHVSCYGGRGRTGLALACVRMLLEDEPPEISLAAVFEASGGPETDEQRAFVIELHRSLLG